MFDHILVPLDGSSLAECVLPHTVALTRAFQSRITLVHVLDQGASSSEIADPLAWKMQEAQGEAYLAELTSRLRNVGVRTNSRLLEGDPADNIVKFAGDAGVALIVLSSHGQSGLSKWNISSVAQKVILRSPSSVMLVRAYAWSGASDELETLEYRRLLAPLDCSQRAECVLGAAITLARNQNAAVLIAHVLRKPQLLRRPAPTQEDIELANEITDRNRQIVTAYLEELADRLPVEVERRLLIGDSVPGELHQLVDSEAVGLVLVCAHGHSVQTRWPYGSVTTSFIEHGSTPLLIVQDLSPNEIRETGAEAIAQEHAGH